MDLSVAILISQDIANSHPPPKANPSIIAIVGFSIFQTASQQLSEKILKISSDFLPLNSEISAPATKEFGLLLFPSGGLFGEAPAKIATLIESSDIILDEILPGEKIIDDDSLINYCKKMIKTNWHPVGTCKMGNDNDRLAVLNSKLQVKGIENLRVFDVSMMPNIVSANTNAPAMAIADNATNIMLKG